MKVVYAKQPFPSEWSSAIFLAGPTPRSNEVPSWRPEALRLLEEMGYPGVVLVPEVSDGEWKSGADAYLSQVEWEKQGLEISDVHVFWVPRDMDLMPALTTNVEFGRYVTSGKVVLGAPEWAKSVRYLAWMQNDVNGEGMHPTLESTLRAALSRIENLMQVPVERPARDADALVPGIDNAYAPVMRRGGEREVPLHIWSTRSFQAWYQGQTAAGNRLDGATLLWHFKPPKMKVPFAWVLRVNMWVAAEGRHKTNEYVFARADISNVLLYESFVPTRKDDITGQQLLDTLLSTEVVLIREFRSPARTPDGFIRELTGGSSHKPSENPLQVASAEVHEETGLIVNPSRFVPHGSRQLAGTLSAHHAHLYSAELTGSEMAQAKALARAGDAHGVVEDTERTYIEVTTFGKILTRADTDWSTVGMVTAVLLSRN